MADASALGVVLIVDDDPLVRAVFSRVLASGGFSSIEASTAEEALALLDDGLMPAAVLLDLVMPGMSGLAFLLHLRASARYRFVPVTIVTGDSLSGTDNRGSAVAALDASMSFKPVHSEELLAVVGEMLGIRG
jgi:CheY-like chemotaxis protein